MTSFCLYYYRQPDKTKVVYIIQTDLKGRLPMKLIESVLPSNQLSFFSSIRKAIKDGILDKWTAVSISVFHPYTYISHKSCDGTSHVTVTWLHNSFCQMYSALYYESNIYITVISTIHVQFIFLSELSSAWKPWILAKGKILVWWIAVMVLHFWDWVWSPINSVHHELGQLFVTRPHTAIAR